ncbi:MAG: hypothetical protein OEM79_07715 [Nitrosopumilus sp.]|nr:hypothetical protein [Nitrosopumilus sp.]
MKKIFLCAFLILILFPVSSGFSQKSDTLSTLSVALTSDSPFVYKDNEGYTVVVGNVENKNEKTSVNSVQLRVNFYDETGTEPLETIRGGTILEVIPENGNSPYMIKSNSPNPNITQVSVMLEGFLPSPSKSQKLVLESTDISFGNNLQLSGFLTNGASPITDTFVYLALYDAFEPPRLVGVSAVPLGEVSADEKINFNFNEEIDPRAKSYQIFAQSNVFYSNWVDGEIPQQLTKLVTISNVSLNDSQGIKLSEIKVGSTVNIQSNVWVQFSAEQKSNETPYTYYAQVKNSEIPTVEFLGKFDGRFIDGGSQSVSIDWIPEHDGIYFIETFVWDRNSVPIADKGPIILLVVN